MSKQKAKKSSQELGLEVAAICGKHFLKTEHLHYGLWNNGLEIEIANLYVAQENYTNFLVSHIPEGVKTILDVGCGTGKNAERLIGMGYKVDCVSPSPSLSEKANSLLKGKSRIFTCMYEQLNTECRYDLILFSESFQYVNLQKGLQQTVRFLNDDGYLLICDVFKKDIEGRNVIGGGHKLRRFTELIAHHPLKLIVNEDITEQTAPSIQILDDTVRNVVTPVLNSTFGFLTARYPLTTKFLRWKYRRKIDRVYKKYLNGRRTSEDFKRFKTYRLFIYRKICPSQNQ